MTCIYKSVYIDTSGDEKFPDQQSFRSEYKIPKFFAVFSHFVFPNLQILTHSGSSSGAQSRCKDDRLPIQGRTQSQLGARLIRELVQVQAVLQLKTVVSLYIH